MINNLLNINTFYVNISKQYLLNYKYTKWRNIIVKNVSTRQNI